MDPPYRDDDAAGAAARRRKPWLAMLAAGSALAFLLTQVPLGAVLPPRAPTGPEALHFFDHVALMRGQQNGPARPGHVRKWTGPVAVFLHDEAPRHAAEVSRILALLTRWTGVPFHLAKPATWSRNRIHLHILPHQVMVDRYGPEGALCMTSTFGNGGVLHTAWMEVSARYVDCLEHEMMHAIGFDNHWAGPMATPAMPSVLAPRYSPARPRHYSRFDEMAIRLLYDPRLVAGTPRPEALGLARRILIKLVEA